jgi:site-specific DNA recombinase
MPNKVATATIERRVIRCAIYTRKSTEEGLEQEFNSLDAQYEACDAFITSQRHEGWKLVNKRFDDGGFSGGTMERPGLKRILADVEAGKVDVIVVYKVDRLTRTLSDFARIVDVLDAREASFVSVTQSFNTTTSMGRLTLNVLLSFAQFEREVTGERIRDKIAASKKKGMWMGGPVPLGYDVEDRKLVINDKDAVTVRHIFSRYGAMGCGQKLIEELREDGYRTKIRQHRGGRIIGGVAFGRGMLFGMLSNRIYVGDIVHKGVAHDGEHSAIIDPSLWDRIQAQIAANRHEHRARSNAAHSSLLAGIIQDAHGRKMTPSHAVKKGKRYRYYVTHSAGLTTQGPPAARLPAFDVERIVIEHIRALLNDRLQMHGLVSAATKDAAAMAGAIAQAADVARLLDSTHGKRSIVTTLTSSVHVQESQLLVCIDRAALLRRIGVLIEQELEPIELVAPAVKIRNGLETKLIIPGAKGSSGGQNKELAALLIEARATLEYVLAQPERTITELAREKHQCRKRMTQLVRIAWLAPSIVRMILKGKQPAGLTPARLLGAELPICWTDQRRTLGFD